MKRLSLILLFSAAVFFTSCSRDRLESYSSSTLNISIHKADVHHDWLKNHTAAWHPAEKYIVILFGYGFNSDSFIEKTTSKLQKEYGLESDGGLILPLRFPDDFKRGGAGRISLLTDMLKGKPLRGIILLGAPDNTHAAVSDLKACYGGVFPFPVFSYFPQDDVLGMEYASDFVLEDAQSAKQDENTQDEHEQVISKDVSSLIESSIKYMTVLEGPLPADGSLHKNVQTLVGSLGKITRYVDAETGLQSINHFIMD